jgi:hypothetical protein
MSEFDVGRVSKYSRPGYNESGMELRARAWVGTAVPKTSRPRRQKSRFNMYDIRLYVRRQSGTIRTKAS